MAKLTVNGMKRLDDLFMRLQAVGEVAEEVVEECAPILVKSTQSAIESSASRGYSKGDLSASINSDPVKENQWGYYTVVRPIGNNRKGVSNAYVAKLLEYGHGTTGHKGDLVQDPAPWRVTAAENARPAVEALMEKKIEEWAKEIGG